MQKKLKILFVALAIITLTFIFVGCKHTHEFGDWQKDATKHYKFCSCGDTWGEAEHNLVNDVCSVCVYIQSHTHKFTLQIPTDAFLNTVASCSYSFIGI